LIRGLTILNREGGLVFSSLGALQEGIAFLQALGRGFLVKEKLFLGLDVGALGAFLGLCGEGGGSGAPDHRGTRGRHTADAVCSRMGGARL
jgi:hypothetical protein